jgi:hypothetical protein
MISTVTLSFDLTYVDPLTGAIAPRGIVTDSTNYSGVGGLGIDLELAQAKGLGIITFNGDVIVNLNTVGDPMINLQDWGNSVLANETPFYAFPLPLDANGNVANGVYTLQYSLRLNTSATPFDIVAIPTATSIVVDGSTPWLVDFLEAGDAIGLFVGAPAQTNVIISSIELSDPNILITTSTNIASSLYEQIQFDITHLQFSGVFPYAGCTQVNADVSFVYDCEVGDSGTWAVANTTPLASNEVVASLNCAINYPSWAALSPIFPGNVVVTSLPYPPPGVETPLATGTYTVSLTQQIQQTQTSGLIILYSRSVIKEFQVTCAGSLCGLVPCIENLRAAHQAELTRNRISKYQVFVDNVLMYYIEAMNYRSCGELDKYRAAVAHIQAQLDASGCECACCDNETYYWVSNNSANSVIDELLQNFQFRLYDGAGEDPGDTQDGVQFGALWQDVSTGIIYRCTNATPGSLAWEEYYLPGIVDASTVTAVATPPYLNSNNVQGQLTEAGTQFAFQFLQNAQYDADINALQADVAALDGTNGLTKVGDEFQLGGALDANTQINANSFSLTVATSTGATPLIVSHVGTNAPVTTRQILGSPSAALFTNINCNVEAPIGGNGFGSSITTQLSNSTGALSLAGRIVTSWEESSLNNSQTSIYTRNGANTDPKLVVKSNGQIQFNEYDSTTFEDLAPAYLLGVDIAGNVVQATGSSGPLVYVARITQTGSSAPTATVIANTTGATFTWDIIASGIYSVTASSPVLTTNKTAIYVTPSSSGAYIMMAGIGSTTQCTVTSSNAFGLGGFTNGLINGAIVKIEVYP